MKIKPITIKLKKNLRRDVLRGSPWVYRHAIVEPTVQSISGISRLYDMKGEALAWGIYCPKNAIAVRVISLAKNIDFSDIISEKILDSYLLRDLIISSSSTNCYRLINGEGDGLPGLICDVYNDYAVLQFDGEDMASFWGSEPVLSLLAFHIKSNNIIVKPRSNSGGETSPVSVKGLLPSGPIEVLENNVKFYVDILNGQKTGFFLDQRSNRNYLSKWAKDKSVLNMFSYSGGFSIYAGLFGAKSVTSMDISESALSLCKDNWKLNELDEKHHNVIKADIYKFLESDSFEETYDLIVVDPPSMAKSEKQKEKAILQYIYLFSGALKIANKKAHIFFSSCSSHINYDDFFEIILQALSKTRNTAKILNVGGQGFDHPYPQSLPQARYLKFVHLKLD